MQQGEWNTVLQIADLLAGFWLIRGYTGEGLHWLRDVLERSRQGDVQLRASVVVGAGWLAHQLGDLASAERYFEDVLAERTALDLVLVARALIGRTTVLNERGDYALAKEAAEENVIVAHRSQNGTAIARALTYAAECSVVNLDLERGIELAERAVAASRSIGDTVCLAAALDTLGLAERLRGSKERAEVLLDEAVRLHKGLAYKANAAEALFRAADAALAAANAERARGLCDEGLILAHVAGNSRRVATALRVNASIALASQQWEAAVALVTGAEALYARLGMPLNGVERLDVDAVFTQAGSAIGVDVVETIRERSSRQPPDELVAEMLKRALSLTYAVSPE